MQQVLLESNCDCGFAGSGETCEPNCEAGLLAEFIALFSGERWVPGDVSGGFVRDGGVGGVGTYVAILIGRAN